MIVPKADMPAGTLFYPIGISQEHHTLHTRLSATASAAYPSLERCRSSHCNSEYLFSSVTSPLTSATVTPYLSPRRFHGFYHVGERVTLAVRLGHSVIRVIALDGRDKHYFYGRIYLENSVKHELDRAVTRFFGRRGGERSALASEAVLVR